MKSAGVAATLFVSLAAGLALGSIDMDTVVASAADRVAAVDLNGDGVDPFDVTNARAITLIFMDPECPVAQRVIPQIVRLHEEFSRQRVHMWLVYPDADPQTIRRHHDEFGLRVPPLRDPGHTLVARAGVTVTPEAAVFAGGGRLVYRGRIDDRQVAFGVTRPTAIREDLRNALGAIVSGRLNEPVFAPAVGCYIRRAS